MNYDQIIEKLKSLESPKNVEGMARYGINPNNNFGVSIYILRPIAKKMGRNHDLALKLWDSGIHDARLLACFIDDPEKVTGKQMDSWSKDFDSWDICDQACTSLFDQTSLAWIKAFEWAERDEEFVKRAAFSLIAGLSVHDKKASDEKFEQFIPIIKKHAIDERNYVKKANNWALRNIGKRNKNLNKKAIKTAEELLKIENKTAKWIAKDALKELTSEKVKKKLNKNTAKK
ncbi:MAG: DNA alkylation repair protein [Candidatus Thermoplasmatota archaeon]|nr:DNA alkylation repair protein [Candidatus Thermoplasmatota archaeon]